VRVPDRRGALAAVAKAALVNAELRRSLATHFPELELGAEESVCR
jgi:hypothetical protein